MAWWFISVILDISGITSLRDFTTITRFHYQMRFLALFNLSSLFLIEFTSVVPRYSHQQGLPRYRAPHGARSIIVVNSTVAPFFIGPISPAFATNIHNQHIPPPLLGQSLGRRSLFRDTVLIAQ